MSWFLYLIECADDSVYTGITTDVAARFDEHASGKGARYTRSRKPRAVLASFPLPDRSIASRAEYWVKRLTAAQKRELAAGIRTLGSVLPAGMSIDGHVDAAVVAASTRGRKKADAKNAGEAAESAETGKVSKKTAKAEKPAKAVQTGKTPKKAKAAPAAKRAKTGDDAPTKKTSTRGTPDKADKAAKSGKPIKPAAKSSSAGKASGGKPATNGRDDTARAPARSRASTAKASAPAATPRRATPAKRAKDAPPPAAAPAAVHKKRPARKKQNRAAS
ncbi:GIY-YIG nuclease family protein [Burkholderia anthina]|uniref:Excinuclease ABC subunit C n=1 Tax=Burkholderia anthina TaxID=179879 RepID=A0A6P2G2L8_9BURK|nr:GIY-YIG nuclease family protein [Burkholderia anthina]MBM2767031.1 GIY-YIG nuclease family protein [Burkholderia anthina]VVU47666.1 excinuclease ABC subunit C [Burkholderia anthina]